MKKIIFALVAFWFLQSIAYCAAGSTGAEFLKLNLSARSGAMGDAWIADHHGGVLESWHNPAMLSGLTQQQAAFAYCRQPLGVNFNQLSYARELKFVKATAAFSALYGNYGDLEETRVNVGHNQGTKTGNSFDADDAAGSITIAKAMTPELSLGIALRFFRQTIADTSAQGTAFDAGSIYESPNWPLNFGIAIKNMGPNYRFESEDIALPLTISGAISSTLFSKSLLLAFNLEKAQGVDLESKFGLEYNFKETFFVRAGQKNLIQPEDKFTFGAGLRWKSYTLDYAVDPFAALGQTHRISISANF